MSIDCVTISTLAQVKFWLEQGEVIVVKLTDGMGYMEKKGNNLSFTIQPNFGKGTVMENKYSKVEYLYQKLEGSEMYAIKGSKLTKRETNFLDKIADFFSQKSEG